MCAMEEGITLGDADAVARLCERINIDMQLHGEEFKVFCNGKDVTRQIREPEMGMHASTVSSHPEVRRELLGLQRELGAEEGVVAEGRDIGSVVFPDADVKFYLDASPEERGKRRGLQDESGESKLELERIVNDIKKRDEQDSSRAASPLKIPEGALVIDNTEMDAKKTLSAILSLLEKCFPAIVHPDV